MARPRATARAPLSALTNVMIAGLVGLALSLVYVQLVIVGEFLPDLTVFAAIMLIVAAASATGWRWVPLAGALVSSLAIAGNSGPILYDLTHPEAFHLFAYMVVAVAFAVVGVIAGVSAPHSFDIDELNVHVPMASGKSSLALFKPTKPGTYTFYCSVPGHRELGMQGTLIVEP
jgi:Cupredoxin-like domain